MNIDRSKINQNLLTLLLSLGMASNYRLTLDSTIWSKLTSNGQFNTMIFDLCLNFISISILIGSIVLNFINVKTIIKINVCVLFASVVSLYFDVFRYGKVIYMIMGGALGTFYITWIYLMIHGLNPETRSKQIGLILFCVYSFKFFTDYMSSVGRVNIVLFILLIVYIGIFITVSKLKFEKAPNAIEKSRTSFSFLALLGTLIFISYFQVFLVGTDNKFVKILNQKDFMWLNALIHLSVSIGFFIVNKKINYSQLLYFNYMTIFFAFTFGALPFTVSPLICIFYSTYDILGDIFLFNVLGDFITKHKQKPIFLSLIALSMTMGVSGASFFVNKISSHIGQNNSSFVYSWMVGAFAISLIIVPFLTKKVEKDLYEKSPLKAMLNHTLKNIAIQIGCGIEVLRKYGNKDENKMEETLELMSESVNRMMKTVKTINTSQSEKTDISQNNYEMKDIVNYVLDSIKLISYERKINIVTVFAEDTWLECDKEKVVEGLYNIIKNSCEAIEKEEGQIKIEVFKDNNQLICNVSDNGTGISNKHLDKILNPYYSTKQSGSNNFGLGLAYCNKIMKEHNGTIKIESQKNIGTTVSLIFPA